MKRFFRWLWDGCWHVWQTDRVITTTHKWNGEPDYISRDYILQCARCGTVTRKNLKP